MAAGKQTPRQKMINMMYLVLTALLALNVSKEILNAFTLVEGGLRKTNTNFANKNNVIYDAFEKAFAEFPEKTKPYYDAAKAVQRNADELFNYIENVKLKMVKKVDGEEGNLDKIDAKDNTDIPAEIMIAKKGGQELKKKMEDFRDKLLYYIPNEVELQESIKKSLDTSDPPVSEDGTKENWESQRFEGIPFIAIVTLLTQMQSDIRNVESDVITKLHEKIDAGSFKFNKLESTVIPVSNYVFTGDSYRADVFFAAFDTTINPEIYIGNYDSTTNEMIGKYDSLKVVGGKGKYKALATTTGEVKWGGIIKFKKTDGSYLKLPFKQEYQVAQPALVVSPTAMNVFYRGIQNPLEVSVPGVPLDKLEVSISNVKTRTGSNGKFEIDPGSGNTCVISVAADIGGKKKSFGQKEFRVKSIPDPIPRFAKQTGSAKIEKGVLAASKYVTADMGDFLFDVKTPVTSFSISGIVKGELVTEKAIGYQLTDRQSQLLEVVKKGGKVWIEEIEAKTPDGQIRKLGTISVTVL